MFAAVFLTLIGVGHLATGVPLEQPLEDVSHYFDNRIVGGEVAEEAYSPFMVGLLIGVDFKSFICGGSIITEEHVLTAAHCLTSFIWNGELIHTFHGVVGTNEWQRGGLLVYFKNHFLHPLYNPATYKYDGAVLSLVNKLKFTKTIQPVKLNFDWVGGDEWSYVTGWGNERLWGSTPDHLKILYVYTMCPEKCVEVVNAMSPRGPRVDPYVEICTFHSIGHGMCHGDSGSALASVKSGEQSGIVAWGYPCAVGGPDVFARVRPMKSFIEGATGRKL